MRPHHEPPSWHDKVGMGVRWNTSKADTTLCARVLITFSIPLFSYIQADGRSPVPASRRVCLSSCTKAAAVLIAVIFFVKKTSDTFRRDCRAVREGCGFPLFRTCLRPLQIPTRPVNATFKTVHGVDANTASAPAPFESCFRQVCIEPCSLVLPDVVDWCIAA